MTVPSLDGNETAVAFDPPQVAGGTPPVVSTCTPQSGSKFPVGTSEVSCTTTDAQQRGASCSFSVTVTAPPRISATKFLAFGDSITLGITAQCGAGGVPIADSYPSVLQSLLATRYTAQTFTVTNAGRAGESVTNMNPDTLARYRARLAETSPDVVLLQEGINDVQSIPSISGSRIAGALRQMIRDGKQRGATVFVGTLLPERAGSCRAFALDAGIVPVNDEIRLGVALEGAILVDLYQVFNGQLDTLLGQDGLHPSEAGYQKIAETFFESVKRQLEQAVSPAAAFPRPALGAAGRGR